MLLSLIWYFKDKYSELNFSNSPLIFSHGLRTFRWGDLSFNSFCWKIERDHLYQFQKYSLRSKTLVIILETFPGHFMNDISNSYNASSRATWASTMLLGYCEEWDLYWPWNLMKLAYHCKKQKPRLWTCPSFHFLSVSNASMPRRDLCADITCHRFQLGFWGKKATWNWSIAFTIKYAFSCLKLVTDLSQRK